MRNTYKLLFYIKRQALAADGKASVMARITINKERAHFATHQRVRPCDWRPREGRAVGRSNANAMLNARLQAIRHAVDRCYYEVLLCRSRATAAEVRNRYFGREETPVLLLAFFREHNETFAGRIEAGRSRNTYNKYRCVYRHLCRYVLENFGKEDIAFGDLDRKFVEGFAAYLHRNRTHKINTVWIYMIALKHVLALAREKGYIQKDIFAGYSPNSEKTLRNYLSISEISNIARLKLSDVTLQFVRDVFLFSCFTGLAYVDIGRLKFSDLRTIDGKLWIVTRRCKTGGVISVPLFEIARSILSKYAEEAQDNRLFALPSNSWCNRCLRRIMEAATIRRRVTFHTARHTFATTITLSQGVSIEIISKLLGHANIRTTQIYAEVTHARLEHDMTRLEHRLAAKNLVWKG